MNREPACAPENLNLRTGTRALEHLRTDEPDVPRYVC
jgi:hypothetical protein